MIMACFRNVSVGRSHGLSRPTNAVRPRWCTGVSANAACFSQRRNKIASQRQSLVKGSCDLAARSPDIFATLASSLAIDRLLEQYHVVKGALDRNVRVNFKGKTQWSITRIPCVTQQPKARKQAKRRRGRRHRCHTCPEAGCKQRSDHRLNSTKARSMPGTIRRR
jgi:hypothetical protein